ncbi:hypothetical protein B0H19DRAFT_1194043 [Mycena capillaripes]|nr:hypothetical protein B0H19DRAFT_1194043 [Mycena capillaripes]
MHVGFRALVTLGIPLPVVGGPPPPPPPAAGDGEVVCGVANAMAQKARSVEAKNRMYVSTSGVPNVGKAYTLVKCTGSWVVSPESAAYGARGWEVEEEDGCRRPR